MAKIEQYQQSSISLDGAILRAQEAVMARLNCHNIGRIVEFDNTTQRCVVELLQIKQFRERLITPPLLTDVPLIILGAGNAHITMPNPVNTICVLLFMDRNIDDFLSTGESYAPATSRMHDFSDCVALTTFTTLVNPIENYDTEAVTIFNKELVEAIEYESYIKTYSDSIQMQVKSVTPPENEGEEPVTATGDLLINSSNVKASTSAGGQVSVSGKINIQNTSQNLATLIQTFLTACENIATVADESGGTLTPAAKQAFTDLKTQFEELLI